MTDLPGLLAYGTGFLNLALIAAIACLGLNVQWGQCGLFNAGVAGFMAIGAYTSALLTTAPLAGRLLGLGWPIPLGWLAATMTAGAAAALLGAATLRLRADYLAITTFGAAVIIELALRNAERLTGGPFGVGFIPRPFESLIARPVLFGGANLLLLALLTGLALLILLRLQGSPWGRVLRAIREDEHAANALGKPAARYKVQAFAIGGALMGLAGALQAHLVGFIVPDNFSSALTFQVWAMLIIGGAGNGVGALLGALLVAAIWSGSGYLAGALFDADQQVRAAALRIVAIGILLCAVLRLKPRGLLGEALQVSRYLDEGT